MGNKEQETTTVDKNGNSKISQAVIDELLIKVQKLALDSTNKKLISEIFKLAYVLRELR